jgi:hypothetical protein
MGRRLIILNPAVAGLQPLIHCSSEQVVTGGRAAKAKQAQIVISMPQFVPRELGLRADMK